MGYAFKKKLDKRSDPIMGLYEILMDFKEIASQFRKVKFFCKLDRKQSCPADYILIDYLANSKKRMPEPIETNGAADEKVSKKKLELMFKEFGDIDKKNIHLIAGLDYFGNVLGKLTRIEFYFGRANNSRKRARIDATTTLKSKILKLSNYQAKLVHYLKEKGYAKLA